MRKRDEGTLNHTRTLDQGTFDSRASYLACNACSVDFYWIMNITCQKEAP